MNSAPKRPLCDHADVNNCHIRGHMFETRRVPENKNRAMHPDTHVYILTHTQSRGDQCSLKSPWDVFHSESQRLNSPLRIYLLCVCQCVCVNAYKGVSLKDRELCVWGGQCQYVLISVRRRSKVWWHFLLFLTSCRYIISSASFVFLILSSHPISKSSPQRTPSSSALTERLLPIYTRA